LLLLFLFPSVFAFGVALAFAGLRQEHKAGEKMFVDWAGATIPVYDATTGQAWPASLFVSVLGASSYTYAEATRDQQLEAWIQAHIHALEFFGGVPTLAVPDNTKTAVTRACRYDPDLNPTYQEFAVHYGMGVVPARPYKPRDKAKAESGVQVVERWIVAALRNRKFFSLPELNQAIRELLVRLNERPFRKRDGSRASLFHSLEKSALAPLPAERFDMSQWSRATVNIDYHVAFDEERARADAAGDGLSPAQQRQRDGGSISGSGGSARGGVWQPGVGACRGQGGVEAGHEPRCAGDSGAGPLAGRRYGSGGKTGGRTRQDLPAGHAGPEVLAAHHPGGGRLAAQRPEPCNRTIEGGGHGRT